MWGGRYLRREGRTYGSLTPSRQTYTRNRDRSFSFIMYALTEGQRRGKTNQSTLFPKLAGSGKSVLWFDSDIMDVIEGVKVDVYVYASRESKEVNVWGKSTSAPALEGSLYSSLTQVRDPDTKCRPTTLRFIDGPSFLIKITFGPSSSHRMPCTTFPRIFPTVMLFVDRQ
jgi:hypothetical protein